MNIFRALSQGDGSINETNVTSFLSYILNETNNFSAPFILLLIEKIEKEIDLNIISDILKIPDTNLRQKTLFFRKMYSYSSIPEYRLKIDNKIQDLDILLTITDKSSEDDLCYFLIENKIKKSALKQQQCLEQYKLFKGMDDFQDDVPIFSVLITPDYDVFNSMLMCIKDENENSCWLKWETKSDDSIVAIFKELIYLEQRSEISPIDINTLYIIKSFVDHISRDLYPQDRSTKNFSTSGSHVADQAEFRKDSNTYHLKRFNNHMIRVYDENDDLVDVTVKKVLREAIQDYQLNISLKTKSGRNKNTQMLGKDVINILNNKPI